MATIKNAKVTRYREARYSGYGVAILIALIAGGLQACNGQSTPDSSTSDSSVDSASAPTPRQKTHATVPTQEAIATALAALPAPYDKGDYMRGKQLYKRCIACHSLKMGRNGVGPTLHNIINATAGDADFRYSPTLQNSGLTWDVATLDTWLASPATLVPGNRMNFIGIKQSIDRRDIISYLMIASTESNQ